MTLLVCLMGPVASGKSFISNALQETGNFVSVSIGELCRDADSLLVSEDTRVRAKAAFHSGELISAEEIDELIRAFLPMVSEKSVCLDGFPRVRQSVRLLGRLSLDFKARAVAGVHCLPTREVCEERFLSRNRPEQLKRGFGFYWSRYQQEESEAAKAFGEEYPLTIVHDNVEARITVEALLRS